MGISGALVFVAAAREKVVYVHGDAYPDALGLDTLRWLQGVVKAKEEDRARSSVIALTSVPESSYPTQDQLRKFTRFTKVGLGDDWYSLLKYTQGDPALTLEAGVYEDVSKFPQHSLYCEWAYVVDFDDLVFEVYQGKQKHPPTEGRWVDRCPDSGYPVQRVRRWEFNALPLVGSMEELENQLTTSVS